MKSEVKSLTGLRGVVALWVVCFHFFAHLKSDFLLKTVGNGYLAVDVFFVLSAFLLTVSYSEKFRILNSKGVLSFYKKRVNRIYPVYGISIVFIILFIEKSSWAAFFINAGLVQCFFNPNYLLNVVYWSLSTEWICYLLFPLMLYLIIRLKIRGEILIIAGLVLRVILPHLPEMFIGSDIPMEMGKSQRYLDIPYGLNSLARTIASYLLGIGIALLPKFKIKENLLIYLSLGISLALLLFTVRGLVFIPLLSAIIIKQLYTGEKNYIQLFLGSPIIHFLGNISYSLYIIHYIIKKQNIVLFSSENLNSLILIALSILLSYLSYVLIERKLKIFKV
ncbi:acyltransferase family protein [Chryseobacterium sp. Mn2064]|uniref:acyltransferase family protein n=1 Tax=Chryseobacterium sp. Mn2064 TaxID=3395263 RepID=UPI003BE5126C